MEGLQDESMGEKLSEQQHQIEKDEGVLRRKSSHECPVPKPRGRIGAVLGFKKEVEEKEPRPLIETVKTPRLRKEDA